MTRLALLLLLLPSVAMAQVQFRPHEHVHPTKTFTGDEARFISTWMKPDDRTKSCCNQVDCDRAEARLENGRWRAFSRLQNRWIDIPATKIEREREVPPGAFLCENSSGVICFGSGGGT